MATQHSIQFVQVPPMAPMPPMVPPIPSPFADSLYIPYVLTNVSLDNLRKVLEFELQLGRVGLIESVPQIQDKSGICYYKAYVYFQLVNTASPIWKDIHEVHSYQFQCPFNTKAFWNLRPNTSELRFTAHIRPVHMDLNLYVHPDVQVNTIRSIVEGMDLGFIDSVFEDETIYKNNNPDSMWRFAHPHIWDNKVSNCYKKVTIRFRYWYRTRPAMAFQDEMHMYGRVVVPYFDGLMALTFHVEDMFPSRNTNPYVWVREQM